MIETSTRPSVVGAKPRVLIVPNMASWIIGQMAMHVMHRFSDRYEFWYLTDKMIRVRPDLVKAILPSMDFIFPLTDKTYHLLRQAAGTTPLPPSLLWLHHIVQWSPSMREAVLQSAEIIACTPEWKEQIELECPAGKPITVVPHGVDTTALRRGESQRQEFGVPANAFVIGFVGSKTSNYDQGRKGLDTLLAVVQAARYWIPNLHLSFLGLGWEAEVQQLRLQGISANYVGFVPESELAAFYSSLDTYLMTSRVEGGPCTVLESMACETPVVATRVGLVPDVIVDGETGFSAPIGDTDALLSAVLKLASSASLRASMGKAARAKVVAFRSWDETLRNLEAPFARLQTRRAAEFSRTASTSEVRADQLRGAVHAMDGLMWGVVNGAQRLISVSAAARLVRSCWEGCTASDVLRGVGLVSRLSFRPAGIRKLLRPETVPTVSDFSFSER